MAIKLASTKYLSKSTGLAACTVQRKLSAAGVKCYKKRQRVTGDVTQQSVSVVNFYNEIDAMRVLVKGGRNGATTCNTE